MTCKSYKSLCKIHQFSFIGTSIALIAIFSLNCFSCSSFCWSSCDRDDLILSNFSRNEQQANYDITIMYKNIYYNEKIKEKKMSFYLPKEYKDWECWVSSSFAYVLLFPTRWYSIAASPNDREKIIRLIVDGCWWLSNFLRNNYYRISKQDKSKRDWRCVRCIAVLFTR